MANTAGERKHKPTPRFRNRLREQGKFARSEDLPAALVLLTALTVLWFTGPQFLDRLAGMLDSSLSVAELPRPRDLVDTFRSLVSQALLLVLPLLAFACATAVLFQWFQAGFQFFPNRIGLDWERLSPAQGVKRLVDPRSMARLGFGLIKIAVITTILILELWTAGQNLLGSSGISDASTATLIGQVLLGAGFKVAAALVVLGILDYAYQRWAFERSIMMTDEELREELKEDAPNLQLAQRKNQLRQNS